MAEIPREFKTKKSEKFAAWNTYAGLIAKAKSEGIPYEKDLAMYKGLMEKGHFKPEDIILGEYGRQINLNLDVIKPPVDGSLAEIENPTIKEEALAKAMIDTLSKVGINEEKIRKFIKKKKAAVK
jgi:hypothetical protein